MPGIAGEPFPAAGRAGEVQVSIATGYGTDPVNPSSRPSPMALRSNASNLHGSYQHRLQAFATTRPFMASRGSTLVTIDLQVPG